MSSVEAYEAERDLPNLLDRVANGEVITIVRHGKPVAVLVPPAHAPRPNVDAVIAEIRESRRHVRPDPEGWTVERLIDHGRRF